MFAVQKCFCLIPFLLDLEEREISNCLACRVALFILLHKIDGLKFL